MHDRSRSESGATARGNASTQWVLWSELRPTQGAIGYVQVQAKQAKYLQLRFEERRPFAEAQAIPAVRGPSGTLHVIDHHHWARAWFDMGLPEAPVRIKEDFGELSDEQFVKTMSGRGWLHPFDERGKRFPWSDLPTSIRLIPDDVFQSLAAFVRTAGIFENPGELNAKFAWADFFRQRVSLRPSTVDGFALMLAEAFAASRLPQAKALPGFLSSKESAP